MINAGAPAVPQPIDVPVRPWAAIRYIHKLPLHYPGKALLLVYLELWQNRAAAAGTPAAMEGPGPPCTEDLPLWSYEISTYVQLGALIED